MELSLQPGTCPAVAVGARAFILARDILLDLPQLYTKPTAKTLLETLSLLTSAPPSWDRSRTGSESAEAAGAPQQDTSEPSLHVNPEGVTRYLTSIVSSALQWIDDEDAKEEIWNQASARLSERSGRTAMGAISRTFRIPTSTTTFNLEIHEPALTGDDLGLKTWAASYLLAKRLHTFQLSPESSGSRLKVLELGSGTGLVGLAMAGLGADVILTDLPSIHENLARNTSNNKAIIALHGGSAHTGILDWMNPTECRLMPLPEDDNESKAIHCKFPLILAADSLYSPEHPHMLVDTIEAWLSDGKDAKVIVEFPYRDAYLPEIRTFRDRMENLGLIIRDEGEEKGYDDWGTSGAKADDDDVLVTCWWSIWGRKVPGNS